MKNDFFARENRNVEDKDGFLIDIQVAMNKRWSKFWPLDVLFDGEISWSLSSEIGRNLKMREISGFRMRIRVRGETRKQEKRAEKHSMWEVVKIWIERKNSWFSVTKPLDVQIWVNLMRDS